MDSLELSSAEVRDCTWLRKSGDEEADGSSNYITIDGRYCHSFLGFIGNEKEVAREVYKHRRHMGSLKRTGLQVSLLVFTLGPTKSHLSSQ